MIALAALLLTGCQPVAETREAATVNAEDHVAFWLWAGVEPQPVLDHAERIYLLVGEIRADGSYHRLREPPRIDHAAVWLVLRVETLDWSAQDYERLVADADRWSQNNPRFAGVQIDFDAATQGLDGYANFLRDLRQRLPGRFQLGITGLLDWSANGDPAALAELAATIDEAVFQIYQGRRTVPGYEKWLSRLDRLPMPFRIGLVQGGDWHEPPGLAANPNYRGTVVFLLND